MRDDFDANVFVKKPNQETKNDKNHNCSQVGWLYALFRNAQAEVLVVPPGSSKYDT